MDAVSVSLLSPLRGVNTFDSRITLGSRSYYYSHSVHEGSEVLQPIVDGGAWTESQPFRLAQLCLHQLHSLKHSSLGMVASPPLTV